jgi:hypothetical protein
MNLSLAWFIDKSQKRLAAAMQPAFLMHEGNNPVLFSGLSFHGFIKKKRRSNLAGQIKNGSGL